ncbi:hypothetical protein [Levilactobacillus parabrevis]
MAFLERVGWRYWAVGLVMGMIVPAVLSWLGVSPVWRFAGLLVIVNGGLAVALGRRIYRRTQPGWWLIIWPLVYLLGSYLFLPQYTWSFAVVYLCLAYLGYGLTETKQAIES